MKYLLRFIILFLFMFLYGTSAIYAQRIVDYKVGSSTCTIKFLPRGDMSDVTGEVTWENGTKTNVTYDQEQSSNTGMFVYLEYNLTDELIGTFYFNDLQNKSGKYKNLINLNIYDVKSN
jgi:hypothetical protein